MNQDISIVIVTHNRWKALRTTLNHLRQLPGTPKIIVLDNASSDGTSKELPSLFPEIYYQRLETNKGIGARNLGVRLSSTPFIAFCDDDSWWDTEAFTKALRYFEMYPRVGILAGQVLVGNARAVDPTCRRMSRSPLPAHRPMPGKSVLGFVCCGAIVRKAAFLACGGFETRFGIGCEETLLALNMRERNWDVVYAEDLIAFHHPSPGGRDNRQWIQVRNDLWTVWLKRRWTFAGTYTCRLLVRLREPSVRQGFGQAVRELPWIMRQRAPVDAQLEKELRLSGVHRHITARLRKTARDNGYRPQRANI